jgi:hypothetical protein
MRREWSDREERDQLRTAGGAGVQNELVDQGALRKLLVLSPGTLHTVSHPPDAYPIARRDLLEANPVATIV